MIDQGRDKDREETRSELLAALRNNESEFHRFRETYLGLVERCCDHDPGNDTMQNLKRATILQEIALERYQRKVDTFTELMLLDPGARKSASSP
jgi:hypothetical protein